MKNKKTLFPLEKILGTSLDDYVDSVGRSKKDYELVGVHMCQTTYKPDTYLQKFQEAVPENAEIVVEYRFFCASGPRAIFSGTALVPK